MTVESLLDELRDAHPSFIPFEPYVSGMTDHVSPVRFDDPLLDALVGFYFGDLNRVHNDLQGLEGNPAASYLHGMIHRREGDFWNANYWFRQSLSIARRMSDEPELLTARVQSGHLDTQLAEALLGEWKRLVELALSTFEN